MVVCSDGKGMRVLNMQASKRASRQAGYKLCRHEELRHSSEGG